MQAERLQSYLLVWDERLIIKTFHFLDVLFVQLKKTDELSIFERYLEFFEFTFRD